MATISDHGVIEKINGSPGAAPEAGATLANGSIRPGAAPDGKPTPAAYVRPRYFAWADLLRRVFAMAPAGRAAVRRSLP